MAKIVVTGLKSLTADLKRSAPMIDHEVHTFLKQGVVALEREVKPETPVFTGLLQSNVESHVTKNRAVLFPKQSYAKAVIEGRRGDPNVRLDDIRRWARRKLGVTGQGAVHIWLGIKNRGTKANPYMDRAFKNAEPIVLSLWEKTMTRINNRLAGKK